MAEPLEPRHERAKWKAVLHWIVGAVTDPHRHTTSSARALAFLMWYSLHRYLVTHAEPDYRIVAILVTGGILPLVVRTKSTQEGKLPSTQRAADRAPAPPLAPHEV